MPRLRRRALTFLTCLCLAPMATGCSNPADVVLGRIFGMVTIDGVPAGGVLVTIAWKGERQGQLITSEEGLFNFFGTIRVGSYRITVSGFTPNVSFPETTQVVTLSMNDEIEVNFLGTTN